MVPTEKVTPANDEDFVVARKDLPTADMVQSDVIVSGILLALMKIDEQIDQPQEQLKFGQMIANMLDIPLRNEAEEAELFRILARVAHQQMILPLIMDIQTNTYKLGDIPFGHYMANFAKALLPILATTGLETMVALIDTNEERVNLVKTMREKFGWDIPWVSDANENAMGAVLLKISHDSALSKALDYMKAQYGLV